MSQPHLDGVLKLDELSAELTHETFEADTKDREDHTFSGIMFDVACQSLPRGPVEYIEVQSVAVRGQLGPLTVWSTEGGFTGKHERKDEWTLRYESVHPASPSALVELRLSQPVRLRLGVSDPGQLRLSHILLIVRHQVTTAQPLRESTAARESSAGAILSSNRS